VERLRLKTRVQVLVPIEEHIRVMAFLNKAHTGKSRVPMDHDMRPALQDAHFAFRRGTEVSVDIEVLEDGSVVAIGLGREDAHAEHRGE